MATAVSSISVTSFLTSSSLMEKKAPSILIGCCQIRDIFSSDFPDFHFILDDRLTLDRYNNQFPRDEAITRLDGIQLIPYSFTQSSVDLAFRFKALLPPSSNFFITSVKEGYSSGFESQNSAHSIRFSENNGLSYQQGLSCIEGGNAFLFELDGISYAVIGCHSQVLSLLALEEQGYFNQREDLIQKMMEEVEPSDWAIRMARNWEYNRAQEQIKSLEKRKMDLYSEYPKSDPESLERLQAQMTKLEVELQDLQNTQKWSHLSAFKELLQSPIDVEDRKKYRMEAIRFEIKLELTKQIMAKDLNVDEKNLVILPQKKYHIDMEMVQLGDTIYMQSEQIVQNVLKEVIHGPVRFKKSIQNYIESSCSRASLDQSNNAQNIQLLSQIGCKVVFVPGFFESEKENVKMNFINGLLLNKMFITNQAQRGFEFLQEAFAKCIRVDNPNLDILFKGDLTIQELLNSGAGIRCITRVLF